MMTETSLPVQIWMMWMGLLFMASLLFIRKHTAARWVFLAMLATMAAVLYIWSLTKNVHLFGVAHLLIWFPLSLVIWNRVISRKVRAGFVDNRPFFIWACLLFVTILVSLVFDVRDIYLVMMGTK